MEVGSCFRGAGGEKIGDRARSIDFIIWLDDNVDNHASILIRIKNTCGIQKKVATVLRPL
jgi:hypothetical protein